MLALVSGSVLLLAVIVDYADQVDRIAKNHPPTAVVLGYYRCFLLSIGNQVAPFVALIATLVSLGILSKNNEDTAFKASGVSLHRLAAPILAATAVAALLFFALGEYVFPYARQQEARYRNIIHGRDVDYDAAARTPAERNWRRGTDGRIWHQEESDAGRGLLVSPSVFEFNQDFDLVRRDGGRPSGTGRSGSSVRAGRAASAARPRPPTGRISKSASRAILPAPSPGTGARPKRCAGASSNATRAGCIRAVIRLPISRPLSRRNSRRRPSSR